MVYTQKIPLVELEAIGRVYRSSPNETVAALTDLNLKLNAGEFVAIIGASGSGKSTLINVLGCLDQPTSGCYKLFGEDVGVLSPHQRSKLRRETFGFVFQSYNLIPSITVQENVELPARYAGMRRAEREASAIDLLNSMSLGDRAESFPESLSGGEQQRVAIARALMNGATVILADEPTGALDSYNSRVVLNALKALVERGHTVIVNTHDREVASWADRRIELSNGRVVSDARNEKGVVCESREDILASLRNPPPQKLISRLLEEIRCAVLALPNHLFRAGRLRGLLTIFGIALGIASVILLLAILRGGYEAGTDVAASTGADEIVVTVKPFAPGISNFLERLTTSDAHAIKARVPNLRGLRSELSRVHRLSYGDREIKSLVSAVEENEADLRGLSLSEGHFINNSEGEMLSTVAVIGASVRDELLGKQGRAVGKIIRIGDMPFTVKGVLARVGPRDGSHSHLIDLETFVPLITGQQILHPGIGLDSIRIYVDDPEQISEMARAVHDVIVRRKGGLTASVNYHAGKARGFQRIEQLLSGLIVAGGILALCAGAIGIASTMLLSIGERLREIGIRMACGALTRDIFRQIFLECLLLAIIGGVLGVAIGHAVFWGLLVVGIPATGSFWHLFIALGTALVVGLVSGVVPAYRAAAVDPVVALAR